MNGCIPDQDGYVQYVHLRLTIQCAGFVFTETEVLFEISFYISVKL